MLKWFEKWIIKRLLNRVTDGLPILKERLEEYWEKFLEGVTDGSHDKHWQDLHVNGLWKVDDYRESLKGTEPGA